MNDRHGTGSRPYRRTFALDEARAMLSLTPAVLRAWLGGLPPGWEHVREGDGTWSPYDVLGHLVHGEKTDWIPRVRVILEDGEARPFDPFDRFAQFEDSVGKSLGELLDEFRALRSANLARLDALDLRAEDLDRRGLHPALGSVTLGQLLATWVAHDLDHLMQIARVLGTQYADEVGPWRAYLRVISGQPG